MSAAEETTPLVGAIASPSDMSPSPKERHLHGRRISLWLARWIPNYGSHASLTESWNFFEEITLPRRVPSGDDGDFTKVPSGTPGSDLYPAWTTPQRELNDFGTGVAVYFETLRALVVICFIAGLLYLPSILYYRSDEYASHRSDISNQALRGSLICTETKWVPCPNCTLSEIANDASRIATCTDKNLTFLLKNDCAPLKWQEGMNHFGVLCFLIVSIVLLGFHQKHLELSYDEDVLTASDYSIVVKNPPPDATDPQEWKDFFSQFGKKNSVVYVTVALDNDVLIKALTKRRALLQKASFKLPGRSEDDSQLQEIPTSIAQKKKLLYKKLTDNHEACMNLLQKEYPVSAVFVTFETEQCQRSVLQQLTVGTLAIATNDASDMPPEHVFRGNLVLDIEEAVEPSAIRWKDLNKSMTVKVLQRICTGAITLVLIALGFVAVRRAFQYDVHVAAYLIAILNILVPNILKLVNNLESHSRQGTFQASLYAKITIFRWVNTAIITTIIKPFTSTIAVGEAALIPAVYAVLKAEIVTAPVLHMCDIVGQVKRFILAPRAANQAAMNSYFRGSIQNLGEKYTNMTKVIFLCCFYSVIFPASFFFGAVAIAATYATDKFLLMRSWAQLPKLGDDVALLSRRVFFPLTLVVLVIVSEFYWSAYPFDDACEADMVVSSDSYSEYIGKHAISTASNQSFQVTFAGDETEQVYRFCDQDYLERVSALLRFFQQEKDDWMSPDQQLLTYLFGILCVAVLVILGCVAIVFDAMPNFREEVGGVYTTTERDSGEMFSDQENIKAYVPEVSSRSFSYPLIACNGVSKMNQNNIGWSDPVHSHDFYDMSNDVSFLTKGRPLARPVLGTIQYFAAASSGVVNGKKAN